MPLWKKVALIQIKLKTYFIKKNRALTFSIIYAILIYWALYLGPNLFNIIIPNKIKEDLRGYGPHLVLFVEAFISSLFLVILVYPFYNVYKKERQGYNFFILSSPIKEGDLFIGEFLGDLAIHSAVILLIIPVLFSILLQIKTLNLIQYILIFAAIFGIFTLSLLLGTIFAKLIQAKMIRSKNTKKLGDSYLCFIILGILLFMSLFRFINNLILYRPLLKNILLIYPSSWYSNLILFIIDPSFTESYYLGIWPNILLAFIVPILIFYVAYKKADGFYSLDFKEGASPRKSSRFVDLGWKLPLRGWGMIGSVQFKVFFRNKENYMRILSILFYNSFMCILIFISLQASQLEYIYELLFYNQLIILIISLTIGLVSGLILGMNNIFQSKDLIFRYKRSPRGLKAMILSYIILILVIFIFQDIFFTVFNTILFQFTITEGVFFFLFVLLSDIIFFGQIMGLQLYHPFFKEQESNIHFIFYILGLFQIISFIISLSIMIPNLPYTIVKITPLDFYEGLSLILVVHLLISLLMTISFIIMGVIKIQRLE